jgi:hypothetical protein
MHTSRTHKMTVDPLYKNLNLKGISKHVENQEVQMYFWCFNNLSDSKTPLQQNQPTERINSCSPEHKA